ncbi:hypothetical protein ACFLYS_00155 [Chloroflexota bacterium]
MSNPTNKDLPKILYDGLMEHGFLFQERCAEVLEQHQNQTEWLLLTGEYPVSAKIKDTRIDIILKDVRKYQKPRNIYAIIECKRVNPQSTQ